MQGKGKVAAVTGGGQGIGKAIARRLLEDGWRVAILERDVEAGRETVAEYARLGEIAWVDCDVAQAGAVDRAFADIERRFAGLDALVNNAGFGIRKPPGELTLDEWQAVLATNLTGAFLGARRAAPLLAALRGAIVSIASTRALMSEPDNEAYAASKGGLVALTHALAASLGPQVRVNCISPGWIDVSEWKKSSERRQPDLSREDHAQHPVGRVGRPQDVAALAAWLIGPDAGFVTGANFVIDGGMTRKMIYA